MIFYWSLSDSKSPRVSRTLLSILADLNNAIVCLVSVRPLISNSSKTFTQEVVLSTPLASGITITFMFHSFLVPWQDLSFCLFFDLFDFNSVVGRDGKVHYSAGSLFFSFCLLSLGLIFLRGLDNLLVSHNPRWFWFVHIPSYSMVKFRFLAQFPVDHLPHPVMSYLFFLCLFTAFAYFVINRFISVITLPTFAILLYCIYFCFNIINP